MHNSANVFKEIEKIILLLVKDNLADNINQPVKRRLRDGSINIEWGSITNIAISLKNIAYKEIYDELDNNRDYTIKLVDGALIHIMYKFKNGELDSHRLAFYPSPYLESYQNEPEIYDEDEIYADIIYKNIVAFPIRFDYNKEEVKAEFHHPKSHGTLGQYKNCRIPVYGPISPSAFIEFIFKNFYGKAYYEFLEGKLIRHCKSFYTINKSDMESMHFNMSY